MDAGAELTERPGFVELALADAPFALDEEATQEKERARAAPDRLRADRDEDLRELTHRGLGYVGNRRVRLSGEQAGTLPAHLLGMDWSVVDTERLAKLACPSCQRGLAGGLMRQVEWTTRRC